MKLQNIYYLAIMKKNTWAGGLVRIWQQPPKLQVGGPNPSPPVLLIIWN